MEFSDLIDHLGQQIGGTIVPDDDGLCVIEVEGLQLAIQGFDELRTVALLGEVGEPPPEQLEQLYATLLGANFLFRGTFGATLARNPDTNVISLCKYIPYVALDGRKFIAEIGHFISTLQEWRKTLTEFRASVAAQPQSLRPAVHLSDPDAPGFNLGLDPSFMRV